MPMHMGIMCDACLKVHLIATSPSVRPSPGTPGMYLLTCRPPCSETREFREETMRPYRVPENMFQRGYAEEGQYELVNAVPEFLRRQKAS